MQRFVLDVQPRYLDIKIHRGDSFGEQWEIDIPDYSGQGGPACLDEPGVQVRAQVRPKIDSTEILATFEVTILDAAARTVQPYLYPEDTMLINKNAFWDIEVFKEKGARDFRRTFIQGKVIVSRDTTRV